MRFLSIACLLSLLAAAIASGQAFSQPPSQPPSAPAPQTPAERMLNEMLKPSSNNDSASPSTRPQPPQVLEPVGHSGAAPAGGLLREGSDIVAQHGHLKKLPDAIYSQFVFDGVPGGAKLAPMLVLPNLQLMSMEDAASATKEDLDFTVSGMVTEYRDKNYVLLEPGPDEVSRRTAPRAAPEAPTHGPASADQMLKQMLTAEKPANKVMLSAEPLQIDLTSGPAAVAPKAPTLTVLPDRSQIFDRVCRLAPSADGMHEELTFDADGAGMGDPPLIVLPNLKLMDLEKAAGDHKTRVRVTGIITEYRGRNHILLQKVVVMPDSDRQF